MSESRTSLSAIFHTQESAILDAWLVAQTNAGLKHSYGKETELRAQSTDFLNSFGSTLELTPDASTDGTSWEGVKDFLESISRARAKQGYSPSETALFIFSLKETLLKVLRKALSNDPERLADESIRMSIILDKLGLHTIEVYQKTREEVITRQQQELMELSTPVVRLWDEVLALPLIGTLDSARTQVVMESLLQEIVQTGARIAIIDITGVPTVDTLVAQHLLKTVAAARLMGADCIISGIRPQIAQTIVHLGVELNDVVTKATLADAFALALTRTGKIVVDRKTVRQATLDNRETA
jgi:rsbT co-antagonist protein RsbR